MTIMFITVYTSKSNNHGCLWENRAKYVNNILYLQMKCILDGCTYWYYTQMCVKISNFILQNACYRSFTYVNDWDILFTIKMYVDECW